MCKKLLIWTFVSILSITTSFAAGNIDHFQVKLYPENAKAWEALDLTIEAVDVNNSVVTDYKWMVLIFSESDAEAELPIVLEDNTYTFLPSDQWKVVFENAVKFNLAGLQNIYVYDFNEDTIFGLAEVNISQSDKVSSTNISIISPENWLIIWENKIKISGTSDKNHQIKLLLNWKDEILTMTNDSWVFEREMTGLIEWENTFQAFVLDSESKEIWASNVVKIRVEKNTISLTQARAIPEEVDSESAYEIEVIATPGLKEVQAVINDIVVLLPEIESWKYTAKSYAPKDEWSFPIDVILKDDLGREVKELWAASIKVNPVLNVAEEPEEVEEPEEPEVNVAEPEVTTTEEPIKIKEKNLKIKWLKLVELKSKSILTWDELKDAKSYNVYKKLEDGTLEFIENVKEAKFEVIIDMDRENIEYDYFAVKAVAETDEWEEYEWDLSEATKIQTGPEMFILLILALLIGWIFLWFRQRKS